MTRKAVIALATASIVLVLPIRSSAMMRSHPHALWRVVHNLCVPNKRLTGLAIPCFSVDLRRGFAVVADPSKTAQLLVVPTRRITGVESPDLLDPDAPNYWRYAWESRGALARRLDQPVPRDAIGMGVNSVPGRTQDQLHIHIDCLRQDVRRAIDENLSTISAEWSDLAVPLRGHQYRALWVAGDDLGDHDPFKLLAADPALVGQDIGPENVAVAAADRPGGEHGFVVLTHRTDAADRDYGVAEELLDHHCRAFAR